jgi:tetratricopeptide (TPR) repeat protein
LNKYIVTIFLLLLSTTSFANDVAIGDSAYYKGDYEQALKAYVKFVKSQSLNDIKILAEVYAKMGTCKTNLGKNEDAIGDYFSSIKYYEKLKKPLGLARNYYNIANIYAKLKVYDKCEQYIDLSEQYYLKTTDTANLGRLYGLKAVLYNETRGSRESIDVRLQALEKYGKHFDDYLLQEFYFNLADSYAKFKTDSALLYYNKTLEWITKTEDSSVLAYVHNNLGSIYLDKNDLTNAGKYLNLALSTNFLTNDSNQTRVLYENLSSYYYKTGAYEKAYEYADSSRILSAILFNKEKTTVVTELSEKYEAEKKDATITEQKKENKIKTTGLIATAIGLGFVALLAAFSFKQYKKTQKANALLATQNDAIQNLNNKLHEANQTKASLFSIISHDLRAPLSSLYALLQTVNLKHVETANNEKVTSQTKELLDTMENLLLWSKSQLEKFTLNIIPTSVVDVFKSVEALYLPIITSKKITVEHHVEGNGTINSDPDLLQVICRNIYSNALQNAPNNSTINFHYQLLNDFHIVECSNYYDSKKVNNSAFFSEKGLGIIIIKDFCEKLNGTVHFTSGQAKFTVLLRIPSQKNV